MTDYEWVSKSDAAFFLGVNERTLERRMSADPTMRRDTNGKIEIRVALEEIHSAILSSARRYASPILSDQPQENPSQEALIETLKQQVVGLQSDKEMLVADKRMLMADKEALNNQIMSANNAIVSLREAKRSSEERHWWKFWK